jgi:hypothetical protein
MTIVATLISSVFLAVFFVFLSAATTEAGEETEPRKANDLRAAWHDTVGDLRKLVGRA